MSVKYGQAILEYRIKEIAYETVIRGFISCYDRERLCDPRRPLVHQPEGYDGQSAHQAIARGAAVVTFDHKGAPMTVPERAAIKVPVTTPEATSARWLEPSNRLGAIRKRRLLWAWRH